MTEQKSVVVLVHGAFAESASWNGVIEQVRDRSVEAVAVANPLRSLSGDAAYVRDVIAGIGEPVVLVGHSYGGMVITEAASDNDSVLGLVYVNAFAPEHGESAFELSTRPRDRHDVRPQGPGAEADADASRTDLPLRRPGAAPMSAGCGFESHGAYHAGRATGGWPPRTQVNAFRVVCEGV